MIIADFIESRQIKTMFFYILFLSVVKVNIYHTVQCHKTWQAKTAFKGVYSIIENWNYEAIADYRSKHFGG